MGGAELLGSGQLELHPCQTLPVEVEPAGFLCPPGGSVGSPSCLLGVLILVGVLCIFRCGSSIFSYCDNLADDTFCYRSFRVERAFCKRGAVCYQQSEEEPAGGDSGGERLRPLEPSEQNPCLVATLLFVSKPDFFFVVTSSLVLRAPFSRYPAGVYSLSHCGFFFFLTTALVLSHVSQQWNKPVSPPHSLPSAPESLCP